MESVRDRHGDGHVIWARSPVERSMRKRTASPANAEGERACHLAAVETILMGQFPCVMAHLITTRWDDGGSRTPGTIQVKTMGSSFVLVLKEPDDALQLQVLAQTIDDAFELAEVLLSGESAPWEPDPWQRGRNAKAKK